MKKKINLLLLIIWMTFIFTMSSFNDIQSSNQSNIIVNFIIYIFKINNKELVSLIIRKLAHFNEYLILGILTNNYNKKANISIIICFIYAITDELHQILVPGRSCQLLDIIIDTLGAIVGIYILNIIRKIKFNIKKYNNML